MSLLHLRLPRFFSYVIFKKFYCFVFMSNSVIHFELIFVQGVRIASSFFTSEYPVVSDFQLFFGKESCPHAIVLPLFLRQRPVDYGLILGFSGLCSFPLVYGISIGFC